MNTREIEGNKKKNAYRVVFVFHFDGIVAVRLRKVGHGMASHGRRSVGGHMLLSRRLLLHLGGLLGEKTSLEFSFTRAGKGTRARVCFLWRKETCRKGRA